MSGSSHHEVVHAFRGTQNQVSQHHEGILENIWRFLEDLRVPTEATTSRSEGRIVTLPKDFLDWYVPRSAQSPTWELRSAAEETQLHKHLATLHNLGIPTFLREQQPTSLSKFSATLEVLLEEDCLPQPGSTRNTFWAALQEGLVQFAVAAVAEVAVLLFGPTANSTLIAIYDASGYSLADCHWKMSLRINCIELAVTHETARHARGLIIERLQKAWPKILRETWAKPLLFQVEQRPWESEVLESEKHQRMVWCDVAQGESMLPENCPLVPYALLHVVTQSGGLAQLRHMKMADDLPNEAWAQLGSLWTAAERATDLWHARVPRPTSHATAGRQTDGSQGGPSVAHASTPIAQSPSAVAPVQAQDQHSGWVEYRTSEGRPYYHKQSTGETVWELNEVPNLTVVNDKAPAASSDHQVEGWKVVHKSGGVPHYYYNSVTNESSWELPEGQTLIQ
eukprot:CAMPEP_0172805270 /NCGR_PEP_ID=MMETSP1075-20121228/5674_1 /TAXON_ID=2916 /ORGANISM="Ceratium fusus, Strain PA161109" /LENGTH=451 /DNA_ID=CAMNT_0013643951 /DNA_START=35 /DNA_END=1390 /DNA_ORIENTATION=-